LVTSGRPSHLRRCFLFEKNSVWSGPPVSVVFGWARGTESAGPVRAAIHQRGISGPAVTREWTLCCRRENVLHVVINMRSSGKNSNTLQKTVWERLPISAFKPAALPAKLYKTCAKNWAQKRAQKLDTILSRLMRKQGRPQNRVKNGFVLGAIFWHRKLHFGGQGGRVFGLHDLVYSLIQRCRILGSQAHVSSAKLASPAGCPHKNAEGPDGNAGKWKLRVVPPSQTHRQNHCPGKP
jgi:hypothetical protein